MFHVLGVPLGVVRRDDGAHGVPQEAHPRVVSRDARVATRPGRPPGTRSPPSRWKARTRPRGARSSPRLSNPPGGRARATPTPRGWRRSTRRRSARNRARTRDPRDRCATRSPRRSARRPRGRCPRTAPRGRACLDRPNRTRCPEAGYRGARARSAGTARACTTSRPIASARYPCAPRTSAQRAPRASYARERVFQMLQMEMSATYRRTLSNVPKRIDAFERVRRTTLNKRTRCWFCKESTKTPS
jgi:hypothetical protein